MILFMPLPSYDEALRQLLDHAQTLPGPPAGPSTETAQLHELDGRVLAEPVLADRDLPPFHRSAMDGYAVRLQQVVLHEPVPVIGTLAAGASADGLDTSAPRGVLKIATGAAVPEAYDAVIPIEQTEPSGDGRTVTFTQSVRPGFAVHPRGADAKAGDTLIPAGTRLNPHHTGIAASAGITQVPVHPKPRVVVLSTGDELLPPETTTQDLAPQQIRNSNGPMLCALAQAAGAQVLRHEHLVDELDATLDGAQRALQDADLVLTSGGVSVGERDHLPAAWQQASTQTILHGVAIQPGKPVLIAQANPQNTTILGLPGNPVSVLATFHLFAWPLIRAMQGQSPRLPWQRATLAEETKPKAQRELFRAATIDQDHRATLLPWQGSGDLSHTAAMHGFVRLPRQEDPLPAGSTVDFLPVLA